MSQKLEIRLAGEKSRKDFLKEFKKQVTDFIGLENKEFLLMLTEIVKNIYDHNGGRGYVKLKKTVNGKIRFKIGNVIGQKGAAVLSESHQENRSVNWGVGLSGVGIKEIAKVLEIDLIIDISSGFVYEGIYQL
jgi:hypothetical protein